MLIEEVAGLVGGGGGTEEGSADPWRFRSLLRKILGEAIVGISCGEFTVLRGLLRQLILAEEIVRPHLPDPGTPQVEAAREIYWLVYVLHTAEAFLQPEKARSRLNERQRSAFERKVLRVLLQHADRYMRRAEILEEMERLLPPPYPDPSRVSQILAELHSERLLMRTYASAQGNSRTSFFSLSRQGIELCRQLELNVPMRLFEADSSKWGHLLQPSRLAAAPEEKERDERIATFYRPQAGVGCSLALANAAMLLAQELRGFNPSFVLVIDIESEESSLLDYLGARDMDSQGLAGLLEDYKAQPESERASWIADAILTERYSFRPVPGLDNLFYLPPFSREKGSDIFQLYASLMHDIRREAEYQVRQEGGAPPRFAESGFIGHFRQALRGRCAKALILAPPGLGPGAYVSTVLLAEELVLFLHPNDPERESIRATTREIIGNCLWRSEEHLGQESSQLLAVTFAFSQLPIEEDVHLNLSGRIERLLLVETEGREQAVYRIVRLYFDARLACERLPAVDLVDGRTRKPSLLAAGYQALVEDLHPYSSLVPAYWQSKEQDMDARVRLRVVERRLREFPSSASSSQELGATGQISYVGGNRSLELPAAYLQEGPKVMFRPHEDLEDTLRVFKDVLEPAWISG